MKQHLFLAVSVLCLNLVLSVEIVPESPVVKFNITKAATLQLQCNIKNGAGPYDMKWKKDDIPVTEIDAMKTRVTYTNTSLTVSDAADTDVGNYSCTIQDGGVEHTAYIFAATTIYVNTPENVNVVEGEKLRIVCNTIGKPPPQIMWTIGEVNYTNSAGNVTLQEDPDSKIENAILLIDNINMTDRGVYKCIGYSNITNEVVEDESMVRVKDKYAALWPFLGICAEVFVLCGIILIYEKKRNKSELEESDTDQSPDQKNTPDHGKDSNLRHRQ